MEKYNVILTVSLWRRFECYICEIGNTSGRDDEKGFKYSSGKGSKDF